MKYKIILVIGLILLVATFVLAKDYDKTKIKDYLKEKNKDKKIKAKDLNPELMNRTTSEHFVYDIEIDDVEFIFITSDYNYDTYIDI